MSETPAKNPLASIMDELIANVMRSRPKDRYFVYNPVGLYRIHTELIGSGIVRNLPDFYELLSEERLELFPMDIPPHGCDKKGLAFIVDPHDLMIADNRVYWVHVPLDAIRSLIKIYVENTQDLKGIQNLVIDWKSTNGSILDRIKAQEFRIGVEPS